MATSQNVQIARLLALLAIAVLTFSAVLFSGAWLIGGEEATADNWVGVLTVLGLFTGIATALAALFAAVVAGLRKEPWRKLLLPLLTLPVVIVLVVLMELFVFE